MSDIKMRDEKLSKLLPKYPGWHRTPFLPVLISLANSVEESDRLDAIGRLFEETLIAKPWASSHERIHIQNTLGNLSWSDDEIMNAVSRSEHVSGRATYGAALRIGLGGQSATFKTIRILSLVAHATPPEI